MLIRFGIDTLDAGDRRHTYLFYYGCAPGHNISDEKSYPVFFLSKQPLVFRAAETHLQVTLVPQNLRCIADAVGEGTTRIVQ